MLRLRRAKNLDLRQQTLLESAYFAVKPPERVHRVTKQYSVVQQYARYLIQERADDPKASVDEVIKSLRRLPWGSAEENISLHVVKAVLKVARTKYVSLPNVADCLSGLARYYPNLVTQLVDRVLEELQRALDSPYKREIQRSLGLVRLLGELYNFTAVSSTIVFDLLYHLLNFGHSEVLAASVGGASLSAADLKAKVRYDPRIPADVDPPSDLFRAQLVCEMLNTCGLYYVRGQAKDRLSKYLMYFQRYLLTKQHVPLHVEFSILDALDSLEELAREAVAQTQKKGRQATTAPVGAMFPRYDNMEAVQAVIEAYELTHLAGDDDEEEDENVRDSGDKGAANENEGEEEAAIDEDGSGSDSEGDEESDSEDEDDDEEEEPEEVRFVNVFCV
jgi:regulator of nonsense transcripts 2